jgi:hypothetical protein
MTQEKIDAIFASKTYQHVDVLFVTSDDHVFALPEQAMMHVPDLEDKAIHSWFRTQEGKLRMMVDSQSLLERMITVTDYVKQFKFKHVKAPAYEAYVAQCDSYNMTPVTKESYDFVVKNVYRDDKSFSRMFSSDKEEIHIETADGHQIVMAKLVTKYPLAKLFFYNDMLIMTCNTNIELMRGDIYKMYYHVLGPKPQAKIA